MRGFKTLALTASAVALLVACGGGSNNGDQSPKVAIKSVRVIGDSLTDSGTFDGLPAGSGYGRLFSVQGDKAAGHMNWPEYVASSYGISSLCSAYKFTGTTFVANTVQSGCTSFGVGGAKINNTSNNTTSPQSLRVQLATAVAAGGAYSASDLLLIDGGGNDIADMIGAYLKGASDGGAAFAGLLASNSVTATANPVASGNAYAVSLANTFFASIKANAIDKGATHIAILNLPAVTKSPKIQEILDGVEKSVNAAAIAQGAAAAAAATAAATKRAETEDLFLSWIAAFNTQLATNASAFSGVTTVVDFNTEMTAQVANPAQFGLTNAKTPACPSTGTDTTTKLKQYNFETCTAAALSANPPTGVTDPNWWKTYAFSDSFHPTPQAYKLMAQLVNRSLISKGWL